MIVTRRRFITFLCCALLLLSQASLAQQEKRDLKLEKETPAQEPTRLEQSLSPSEVVIPRSYALVVGISQYKNLAMKHQLQFSSRDAESIYSILISPEGGNFRAENVHRLIGIKATLE